MAAINQAIAATATEFGQTAQELRSTAQQVIKEVDFVRAELKRSILELPEETRQNADAMRRVVSDQITALNALADVVRRQAGALGLSGAGVHVAPPPPPRENGKDNGSAKVEAAAVVPVPCRRGELPQIDAVVRQGMLQEGGIFDRAGRIRLEHLALFNPPLEGIERAELRIDTKRERGTLRARDRVRENTQTPAKALDVLEQQCG